ncbi:tape measure protein [Chryseobacterium gallinarum]|uniref:Tape measure protein N-terminal domain-containing protein n=1 Tax=Chryseobacterium gallinarum TaxID=1324352 RepID=A0ABX6KVR4_CHRGL|nr:tape measure protein [Chryseobacterium gallinarum]QIY92246.1 hypothetical protein FOB44_16945 [Chryseobacterium gallinarum]
MADLQVTIGADPAQLGRDLSRAQSMINNFVNQVQKIGGIGDALSNIGQKLTLGVTVPIIGLGTAAIKAYGDIEALQKGLEAVMGSAYKAEGEFNKLKEVAKLPGLGMEEAVKGSINLQSIGISAGKSRNILMQFGNAVATVGKGRAEFERAIYGVQQLANTDFPLGEDLNIIKDAIPQVSTLLDRAFGANRSDALAKMGVTSKQVLDVIVKGLEDLPRVSGGIKGAFENLSDSTKNSLARIGDAINKNFNISKIIDKLTNAIENLVSAFEDLSPGMQKTIIVIAGIVAVLGPALVAFGGLLAMIPTIVSGIGAMSAGWALLNTTLAAGLGPIGLMVIAATALGAGIAIYANSIETAADRTERFEKSQAKAAASAQIEIAALDTLYAKTQNIKLSIEERKKAVDDLQKQYPGYFQNINDEIILNGKAKDSYLEVRKAILSASLARAAQGELDKRNEKRLEKELEIRENINRAVAIYKNPSLKDFAKLNSEFKNGFFTDRLNPKTIDEKGIKKAAADYIFKYVKELKKNANAYAKEDNPILDIIKNGQDAINKLDVDFNAPTKQKGPAKGTIGEIEERIKKLQEYRKTLKPLSAELAKTDAEIQRLSDLISKPKKESEKQLAEIFPKGSIEELRQRGELLKKAMESTASDMIRIRKLDIYGHDKDKKGNPFYTGEVISREKARERLAAIENEISEKQGKSIQDRANELEKAFTGYEQMSESFGKEIADKQYSSLLKGSKNYLEYLEKEKNKLQEKASIGVLTDEQKADLVFLEQKINSLNGIKSPFEIFKQDIDNALARIPDLTDKMKYLNDLSSKEFEKSGGNTNAFLDRYKYINDQNQKFLQQQKDFYATYLNDNRSFEQKKIDVEKQFNDVRDKLNKDTSLSLSERLRLIKESYKLQVQAIQASMDQLNQSFSYVLNQTIVDGVVDAMNSIGNAFAQGSNVIQSIGLSLLSTLGGVMIDLGKMAISTGIGLLAITTALKSLNPYVAIAAGAALVALGSIVKGSVSKLGSNMSGGGSGGSVSTGTGANYSGSTYSSNYSTGGSGGGGEVTFRISGSDLVGALNRAIANGNRLNSN